MKNKLPRLTLKTAKALATQVIGTTNGLIKDPDITGFESYKMKLGMLIVNIRYDFWGSDRISVTVHSFEKSIYMLFNPETLEEDFEAEDKQKDKWRREEFEERVCEIGLAGCRKIIDRA